MLTSPITITVNAVAKAMNLVNQDDFASEYRLLEATESWVLKIRHSYDKIKADGVKYGRHTVEFINTTYAVAGVSPEVFRKFTTTFVLPDGQSVTENYIHLALSTYLSATSGANAIKVMNWES